MENKIIEYKKKSTAISAMWRMYRANVGGSPLVGDNGETLQWVDNAKGVTLRAYVTRNTGSSYQEDWTWELSVPADWTTGR